MSILIAKTDQEIQACFPVVHELRPHLNLTDFCEQVKRQQKQGYCLAYIKENNEVKCIAGFRFGEFLAWGKILYIDDLATLTKARGNGYARKMLDWLKEQAHLACCDQIHLDSGYQRYDAHRLYLNYGFQISSHHFALKLTT